MKFCQYLNEYISINTAFKEWEWATHFGSLLYIYKQNISFYLNTFKEWELTFVCKQLIAASATSLLPFKILFSTNWINDSQPTQDQIKSGLLVHNTEWN